jgi:hypothetical protein
MSVGVDLGWTAWLYGWLYTGGIAAGAVQHRLGGRDHPITSLGHRVR